MSLNLENLSEEEVPKAGGQWVVDMVNHFHSYKKTILPATENMIEAFRKEKMGQFQIGPVGFVPEEKLKPVFPKESFLGSWKRFEADTDEVRQLLGGIFLEVKKELMKEFHTLQTEYGVLALTAKASLHHANMRLGWRAFSSADYDNFNRDLKLLKTGGTWRLERESLLLEPNSPHRSPAEQAEIDEKKSLRLWANSYQIGRALFESESPTPEKRGAYLHAVWQRTAQLQENNEIPVERFVEALRKNGADAPELSEFQKGIAEAKKDLGPTLEVQRDRFGSAAVYFETVRGPGFTLDIEESGPLRVLTGDTEDIVARGLLQRSR